MRYFILANNHNTFESIKNSLPTDYVVYDNDHVHYYLPLQQKYEIWYTTIDNNPIDITYERGFLDKDYNALDILSNTYTTIGKIKLSGELYSTDIDVDNDKGVLEGCTNLQTITFPEGTIQFWEIALKNCPNLEAVTIPQSLQFIRANCFEGCDKLKTINFHPDNHILAIYPGGMAYINNLNIDTLDFKYIQYLGYEAFFDTKGIKHINLGSRFRYYGRTTGPIPDTETNPVEAYGSTIPVYALTIHVDEANTYFKTVDDMHLLSKDGTIYYDGVLGGIFQHRIIEIPEGVTTMYYGALRTSRYRDSRYPDYVPTYIQPILEELVLPSTLTKIQNRSLQYCDIRRIVCLAPTPPTTDWSFLAEGRTYGWTIDIYVPDASYDAYVTVGWDKLASTMTLHRLSEKPA